MLVRTCKFVIIIVYTEKSLFFRPLSFPPTVHLFSFFYLALPLFGIEEENLERDRTLTNALMDINEFVTI